jgi:hypothetical protein
MRRRCLSIEAWLGLGALTLAWLFQARVILAPAAAQVATVPDDGYYYLTLARDFWRLGYWSFDHGATVTSGYHPLWAWLLAGLYALAQPGPDGFVRLALAAGVAATWLAAALLLPPGRWRWPALLAGLVVWLSPNALLQSVSAMEWPWAVLAAALYGRRALQGRAGLAAGLGLFLAGVLGSLARSDFGLFPGMWLLAVAVARARGRATQPWAPLAWGVAGALAGIALMLALNHAFTGQALQASALIKQLWAARGGRLPLKGFKVMFALFPGGLTHPGKALVALALAWMLWQAWRTRRALLWRWQASTRPLSPAAAGLRAAALTLAGYLLLYALSADVQPWYSAGMVVPATLLAGALFSLLKRRRRALLAITALLLAFNTLGLLLTPEGRPYPSQTEMLSLGRTLKPAPGQHWGAWDCGIIGYYADCGLVNLDGLANNDLYPLVKRSHAALYPRQRGLDHLLGGGYVREWELRRGLVPPIYGPRLGTLPGATPGYAFVVWGPPPALGAPGGSDPTAQPPAP